LSWGLDALGNFSSVTTDGTNTVYRTHNQQNQVTTVGGNTLAFDKNGNTTTDDHGYTLAFDAWNRLVSVKHGAHTWAASTYDPQGRRITEAGSSGTTDVYFSAAWQVLEERVAAQVRAQYVWSPVYVDAGVSQRVFWGGSATRKR